MSTPLEKFAAPAPDNDPPLGALASFTHEGDGVQVNVFRHDRGFSVVLLDLDSRESVPTMMICPDKETAIRKAQIAAGIGAKDTTPPKNKTI
jgi:hypothetical protein